MPLIPLLTGLGLVAACVVIHASVISLLIRHREWLMTVGERHPTWTLVRLAWWVVLAHVLEIGVWALAYWQVGAFQEFGTAIYFSGATYTTVGYGDVVIADRWRSTAVLEGLTGILMAGWSTAFLLAVLNRVVTRGDSRQSGPPEMPG
jgi:voltage-gated potassium channel